MKSYLSDEIRDFFSSQKKNLMLFVIIGFIVGLFFILISQIPIFTQNFYQLAFPQKKWWYELNFTILDIFQYILAISLYIYANLRIIRISVQNRSVIDKNSRLPNELLIEKYYEKVRHPMYGMFMINGLFFGCITGSLIFLSIGIILVIIQSINGVVEEQKILIPKFKEKYISYKKNVPARYFSEIEKRILMIFFWTSLFDILF
ncbi:methyltransferase family protein [Candidatus Harpocratesius sp.]